MMKLLEFIRKSEGRFFTVLGDIQNFARSPWGSKDNPLVDPATATIPAGLFVPAYPITLTDAGTAAMTGITIPYAGFAGWIVIIPGGAFTWTTATNIAKAGTAVANQAIMFVYNPVSSKWHPVGPGV